MQAVRNITVPSKDLNEKCVLALARESIAVPVVFVSFGLDDVKSRLEVSEVAFGKDERGQRLLTYRVGVYNAKLWYDPKTLAPLKRELSREGVASITETYTCELDADLPDEQFRIVPDAKDD